MHDDLPGPIPDTQLVHLPDPVTAYRNLLKRQAEEALELLVGGLRDGTMPIQRALGLIESQAAGSRTMLAEVGEPSGARGRRDGWGMGEPIPRFGVGPNDVNEAIIEFMSEAKEILREQVAHRAARPTAAPKPPRKSRGKKGTVLDVTAGVPEPAAPVQDWTRGDEGAAP